MTIDDERLNADARINCAQALRSGRRLRPSPLGVMLRKEHLPLKIRQLDDIAIGDAQEAYARTDELLCDIRPQRPTPDQEHSRLRKSILPGLADLREECLAVVAVHGCAGVSRVTSPAAGPLGSLGP